MVSVLHPDGLEAFKERVSIAQGRWFWDQHQGTVNLKLGPDADVGREGFGSRSESEGRRDKPVSGGVPGMVFFDEQVVYRSSPLPGRRCVIL